MSGIYISGMEMPVGCPVCPLAHWTSGTGEFSGCNMVFGKKFAVFNDQKYANSHVASRPDWCPLISVPNHGRLIDADAFEKLECNGCDGACECIPCDCINCDAECRCDFMLDIHAAPTIIQAEEGER